MISRQLQKTASVKNFSLDKNQTVTGIVIFIKQTLPEFEILFKKEKAQFRLEDDISKELLRFFNDKARSINLMFQFNEKKGVDFTIFVNPFRMGALPIFMIEAKRLSKKHHDYVSGRTGGIERIKREQEQFGTHLENGAMIGYIQDHNIQHWEQRVNSWIDTILSNGSDIEWSDQDRLISNAKFSDYTSTHKKVSGSDIVLYHYWINLV